MANRTVAIIGASRDRAKFGNKAVRAHRLRGYEVYPVNPTADEVEGLKCLPSIDAVPTPLDRVSFYVPPDVGLTLIEAVSRKQPKEVYLNPGAESEALIQKAKSLGLNVIVGCSILDIGVDPEELD
jgi:predicted CoA-binding protein